jgi:hypothetical protein
MSSPGARRSNPHLRLSNVWRNSQHYLLYDYLCERNAVIGDPVNDALKPITDRFSDFCPHPTYRSVVCTDA